MQVYKATPLSILKKTKTVFLPENMNGATDQKLGMQTQLFSENKMEWFPSSHTFSTMCIKLKNTKSGI